MTTVSTVELKAGIAKAVITPKKALVMTVTPMMPKKSGIPDLTKTYHDLYARVLVLNDGKSRLAIVTYDLSSLCYVTPMLRERCQRQLGINPSYLVPIATHNHHAPMLRLDSNREYGNWLNERLFDLIKEAIAKEQPAQIYFGCGHAYFARNREHTIEGETRYIGQEPVDNEVQLLKVIGGKQTVALIFNYACHPLIPLKLFYGADYPGFAVDEVEKKVPGGLAMFGNGCGGNQGLIKPRGVNDDLEIMKLRGLELAQEVLRIARGPMHEVTGSISSYLDVLHLPFAPPVTYREALKLAQNPQPEEYTPGRSSNWIRAILKHYREGIPFPSTCSRIPEYPDQPAANLEEVIVAKIGSLVFVALQGEPCAAIGMRIKDALRPDTPVMIFGYMGSHELYLPSRRLCELGDTYQCRVVCTQYGLPTWWTPEVEDKIVEGVLRLVQQCSRTGEI